MNKTEQSTLSEITHAKGPDAVPDEITKTLVCRLKPSNWKLDELRGAIDEWQDMAGHMADLMPSYDEGLWGMKLRKDQRIKRDFPDCDLYAAVRNEAAYKVNESFSSWRSNGKRGNAPKFGDKAYIRLRADHVNFSVLNGNYGVQTKIRPDFKPWWSIRVGEYQREVLDAIEASDVKAGSAEVHLHNDESVTLHLNYTISVEIYSKPALERWVGVDLGEAKMWVASPVESDGPIGAAVFDQKSGEFRQTRERLSRETERLAKRGDLNAVQTRRERRNYTDTMTHIASHEIVEVAVENRPCGIALENLTNYRKTAEDPIHDWPYADLQSKIVYKANERGIPVRKVDPYGTSFNCWKCGPEASTERIDRNWLVCEDCGERRHADVNGAINIGMRAFSG